MHDAPPVTALAARVADGDQEAWGEVVVRYSPPAWPGWLAGHHGQTRMPSNYPGTRRYDQGASRPRQKCRRTRPPQ
jgi:hypothetical protein